MPGKSSYISYDMTTRERVELRERTSAFGGDGSPAARIDRVKGIVHGPLKLLGLESRNGKEYLPDATRKAVPLLEGAPCYIDHPAGKSNARSIRDRFGRPKGVYADQRGEVWAKEFHFNPHHSYADEFAHWVENDPRGIGFSINADGYGYRDPKTNRVVVDEIPRVYSVDLVDGPGTTGGLFEQAEQPNMPGVLTDPAAQPATPDAAAGDTGDHKDALAEAVAALASELKDGSIDHAAAKKKISALLKMLSSDEPEPKDEPDSEAGGKVMEQLLDSPDPAARWAGRTLKRFRIERIVEQKLTDAKLPDGAVTDVFRGQLREAAGDPARMDTLIADRKAIAGVKSPPRQLPPEAGPKKLPDAKTPEQLREQDAKAAETTKVSSYLDKLAAK